MAKKKKAVYSGIGGQAVLEGIMMKNKGEYSVAVRTPDGNIDVKKWNSNGIADKYAFAKIPFIRGVVGFIDSLSLGMKTLSYSSSFYEDDEENQGKPSFIERLFGEKAEGVVMGITMVISLLISIALFILLPYFVSELISKYILNDSLVAIIEGVLRLLIFISYVVVISLMKDIRRLYQYHGAEHKCINCIESGRPLNVKNVMRSSRLHRRCGTSFLIIVMIITIICFFFIRVDSMWLKIVIRLALIPVIAGIGYELLRFAGTHDNIIVRLISVPGMLLQKLTTREPDEEMVMVAIAAIEKVYDWEAFQKKHFKQRMVKKTKKEADGTVVETGDETMEISVIEIEEMLNKSEAKKEKKEKKAKKNGK